VAPSYNTNTSYNTSTWETGAGGSRGQGQPGFSPPDYRLASVILASQEQRSGGLWFEASLGKQFERTYLKDTQHTKGLAEWLK
jgi:hypothetical protein